MVDANNWRFPDLGRDLAVIGLGLLAVAALAGALVGITIDVLWHRHRLR